MQQARVDSSTSPPSSCQQPSAQVIAGGAISDGTSSNNNIQPNLNVSVAESHLVEVNDAIPTTRSVNPSTTGRTGCISKTHEYTCLLYAMTIIGFLLAAFLYVTGDLTRTNLTDHDCVCEGSSRNCTVVCNDFCGSADNTIKYPCVKEDYGYTWTGDCVCASVRPAAVGVFIAVVILLIVGVLSCCLACITTCAACCNDGNTHGGTGTAPTSSKTIQSHDGRHSATSISPMNEFVRKGDH